MPSDRKYKFPLSRVRGMRRPKGKAASLPYTDGETSCESVNNNSVDHHEAISQAVSGAVNLSNGRESTTTETKDTTHKSSSQSCNKSSQVNEKPNCYNCRYRGDIPGNCHSKCTHPAIAPIINDPLSEILSMVGSRDLVGLGPIGAEILGVTGDQHGINKGWFVWPFNFDPVWLNTCNGFEEKTWI